MHVTYPKNKQEPIASRPLFYLANKSRPAICLNPSCQIYASAAGDSRAWKDWTAKCSESACEFSDEDCIQVRLSIAGRLLRRKLEPVFARDLGGYARGGGLCRSRHAV